MDQPGRRRLARRARRRARRGGGRALAVRPRRVRRGQLRAAHVGRRDGQLHRHGARARRPPARAPRRRSRAAARRRPRGRPRSTPATRRTSRSRGRSTSSASRPRRWSSLPSDERFRLHAAPVAEAIARDRAAGLTPRRDLRPSRARRTPGSVDLIAELAELAAARGPLVPRGCGLRRRGPLLRARRRPRPGPGARRLGHGRPAQVVLPGVRHRRARGPGRRPPAPDVRPLARVLPRRRGAAATRDEDAHDGHAGQLNFYTLGFEGTRRLRALKLWMSWKHLGTSGFGRLVEMNDDLAAYLAARCAEADDFEARSGRARAVRRLLPAPARRARPRPRAMDPARARRPPGPAAAALEASGDGWLSHDDASRGRDVPARRDRELPHHRGGHRPAPGATCGASPGVSRPRGEPDAAGRHRFGQGLEGGVDRSIVEAARGGDRVAFDALVRTEVDRVYRLALAITGNEADASTRSRRRSWPPGASCVTCATRTPSTPG